MTVGELLGRISSRELTEWAVLDSLDADDRRIADLSARAEAKLGSR